MANPIRENSLLADKYDRGLITTRQANVADAKVDYTTGDLDTEAEIIAAVNASNTKINAILDVLEALGLMVAS